MNTTVYVLNFTFLFLFSNKMLVFMAGIHKLLIRRANREDPDQSASETVIRLLLKQSDLSVPCLSRGLFGRELVFKILEHLPYSSILLLKFCV